MKSELMKKMITGKQMKLEILGDLKSNKKFRNKVYIFTLPCMFFIIQASSDF